MQKIIHKKKHSNFPYIGWGGGGVGGWSEIRDVESFLHLPLIGIQWLFFTFFLAPKFCLVQNQGQLFKTVKENKPILLTTSTIEISNQGHFNFLTGGGVGFFFKFYNNQIKRERVPPPPIPRDGLVYIIINYLYSFPFKPILPNIKLVSLLMHSLS